MKEWLEEAIVSALDLDGVQISRSALQRENNELWQRITLKSIKTCIEEMHFGIDMNGTKLFPRLGVIFTDQVLELLACWLRERDRFFD